METRANYVIVGIFTLLAVLAAFGFVYWTAGIGDRGETAILRVRIPGSASGLGRGSAVLFNGVKIGDIQRVFIDAQNPSAAIADTLVDRLTPITRSTQADIGLAGLTGQANIELKGGNLQEPNLITEAEEQGRVAEISANPSAVTNLLQTAQDIFERADNVISQLEGFSKDVRGPLTDTARNVQTFSDALAANADGIDRFLESVTAVSNELSGLSGKLDGSIQAAQNILESVDPNQIRQIVDNVNGITADVRRTSASLDRVVAGVDTALSNFSNLATNGNTAVGKVNGILDSVDRDQIRSAISNIEQASRTANAALVTLQDVSQGAQNALQDIQRVTSTVGGRTDEIDRAIADASQLATRLNAASVRVDGILQKVDSLLASDNTEGLIADAGATFRSFRETADSINKIVQSPDAQAIANNANATLASFRRVAETLNGRIGPITDGLTRFTGQGLQNVNDLVRSTQQSINRIERAITDFSDNPQRILSGGEGEVRRYDGGRARR
ncbi:MCE family protein [Mesorhizobium sp. RP14(2022)]|uniref:MCE family protein n=1 Tax=Mesorhizobium liriopis TaxID=2953882 RepID=A0ABT1CD64_9HYPH|nr:MlaD family protein [Mesorhizobium liriopis]MCO6052100.1 MCE family protein [Mesorhizobium liriopis]